jgi:hypothetical protein
MWQPSEPEPFDFDAEEIFNRYAGSDDAWAQFQKDGTINIDGLFSYILGPEVFENISEEFDMYKYHLREKQGGKKQMGWMRHIFYSLTQQLVRQDPAYWAIMAAARPDRNWKFDQLPVLHQGHHPWRDHRLQALRHQRGKVLPVRTGHQPDPGLPDSR